MGISAFARKVLSLLLHLIEHYVKSREISSLWTVARDAQSQQNYTLLAKH